ncbi:UDP-glucuronosyltransferase 2C1 [Cephus cinctus]|uniref:UDP-glucuronosyltransferase n=1 Tax=Cephus cinctus TaxID=211228 RepID=A0AAJ7FMM1_CEPCN|nr:UDP-glucuronosyltransferase 2C1 [Cephus cinctus]
MKSLKIFTVITVLFGISHGLKILGVFPLSSKSHWMMYRSIVEELMHKGHEIDVITPFPLRHSAPNYKEIIIEVLDLQMENVTLDIIQHSNPFTDTAFMSIMAGNDLCELLRREPLSSFIKNTPRDKYDIFLTEIFGANCYLGFGAHFDVPLVAVTSSVILPWENDYVANPESTSYVPNYMLPYTDRMNFYERFVNTVMSIIIKYEFAYFTKSQDVVLKEVFGPDSPGVRELESKIDLLLVNSHYSINTLRPLVPAVVEVGGLHVHENVADKMTPELEKWMNDSTNGVVYFSLGSMVKPESFPPTIINSLYKSFSQLAPIRVLWKANKTELPSGLPDNVRTMDWIPQADVLRHKNVKVFISHGGLMGTQEAVYAGVPIVGIPLFADQALNINNYVTKKIAVRVDFNDISVKTLSEALNTVINDPTYWVNAKYISKRFRDRQASPLDTAVWWIEYVARYGKGSLRAAAVDMPWWQLALIDVYAAIILILGASLYLLKIIVKLILSAISNHFSAKQKKIQ